MLNTAIRETSRGDFSSCAKGVAQVGRTHFSQAVQIIAICRQIDLSKLDSLELKRETLEGVHRSIQAALDSVKVTKLFSDSKNTKRAKAAKLAEAVAVLVANAESLGLNAQEIEEKMDAAKGNDDKTAKAWLPIAQTQQIQENEPPGDPINMGVAIGMEGLTPQANEMPDSFGANHTLNTVLWLLLQRGKVKLSDNPHFYSMIDDFSNNVSIKPWAFTRTLATLKKIPVIHALKDDGRPIIIKSEGGEFYKNIGNVWTTTKSQMTILKDACGTLQPVLTIQKSIQASHFCHHVSGAAKSVDIKMIWERSRKDTTAMEFILHHESEEVPQVAKQEEEERKAQEILRAREVAKREEQKAQDIQREQEAEEKIQQEQEATRRANEEGKAQEMIQKQADDERIREDREIAEGKRKAKMLMQAILEAEAEQKAMDAARIAEKGRIEEERVEEQRRKRVEEAQKAEEVIAAQKVEDKKGWFRRAKDWAKGK